MGKALKTPPIDWKQIMKDNLSSATQAGILHDRTPEKKVTPEEDFTARKKSHLGCHTPGVTSDQRTKIVSVEHLKYQGGLKKPPTTALTDIGPITALSVRHLKYQGERPTGIDPDQISSAAPLEPNSVAHLKYQGPKKEPRNPMSGQFRDVEKPPKFVPKSRIIANVSDTPKFKSDDPPTSSVDPPISNDAIPYIPLDVPSLFNTAGNISGITTKGSSSSSDKSPPWKTVQHPDLKDDLEKRREAEKEIDEWEEYINTDPTLGKKQLTLAELDEVMEANKGWKPPATVLTPTTLTDPPIIEGNHVSTTVPTDPPPLEDPREQKEETSATRIVTTDSPESAESDSLAISIPSENLRQFNEDTIAFAVTQEDPYFHVSPELKPRLRRRLQELGLETRHTEDGEQADPKMNVDISIKEDEPATKPTLLEVDTTEPTTGVGTNTPDSGFTAVAKRTRRGRKKATTAKPDPKSNSVIHSIASYMAGSTPTSQQMDRGDSSPSSGSNKSKSWNNPFSVLEKDDNQDFQERRGNVLRMQNTQLLLDLDEKDHPLTFVWTHS